MVWVPESMDERTEAELRTALAEVARQVEPQQLQAVLEGFLLGMQDELLRADAENPARIRLEEILRKRERGFE